MTNASTFLVRSTSAGKSLSVAAVRRLRDFLSSHAQPVRVFLALGVLMAVCLRTGHPDMVTPLFLGAIASAIAETDDSWLGRLRALLVTLLCFAAVTFSVEPLILMPLAFSVALALAAFWVTMLGAVAERYKPIAFATVIVTIYASAGVAGQASPGHDGGREPLLLLTGAACYGVFSVLWCAVFEVQPVRTQLASLYTALGHLLRLKASMFEPLRGTDLHTQEKRLSLATRNAAVVAEMNAIKESIFRRIGALQPPPRLSRYCGLYLIAQDIHERACASHDDYDALADTFFHSDLLYRCERVLDLQGQACQRLGESIARHEIFDAGTGTTQALNDLREGIAHERARATTPEQTALLQSVQALARSLSQIDEQLANARRTCADGWRTGAGLFATRPSSWRDAVHRVRAQFVAGSPLLRHALRLAIAMAAAYGVMKLVHPAQGYWILLTALLVSQPTYGGTVSRIGQRIAGTVIGLVMGWASLQLFVDPLLQSVLAVVAGTFFFSLAKSRYLWATTAITMLVLLCANQTGSGELLLVPRLIDTALGTAVAGLVVMLVLPHWQGRGLAGLTARAMRGHAGYLRRIAEQYRTGAFDHFEYRLARRIEHDSDAELCMAVADMRHEPGHVQPHTRVAQSLLLQSHTLLGYLSALGAHRVIFSPSSNLASLHDAVDAAAVALEALAAGLDHAAIADPGATEAAARAALAATLVSQDTVSLDERGFCTRMVLVWRQVDALRALAREGLHPAVSALVPAASVPRQ